MEILMAVALIAVIVLIGWVGIIWGIMLPSKAEEHELLKLDEKVEYLKLQLKYLETKEEGEYLAYRLARAMGYSTEEAEKSASYGRDCKIRIAFLVDPGTIVTCAPQALTMEQAQAKLNELIAKKHDENCLQLDKAEEELILKRRQKDWDSRWIEVKPRKSVDRKRKKK